MVKRSISNSLSEKCRTYGSLTKDGERGHSKRTLNLSMDAEYDMET